MCQEIHHEWSCERGHIFWRKHLHCWRQAMSLRLLAVPGSYSKRRTMLKALQDGLPCGR